MMSINLKGGLANQLFQIFSLMGISNKNDYDYMIDKNYKDNRKTYWENILSSIPNCEDKDLEFSKRNNGEIYVVNENRYSQYTDIELNKKEMPNVLLKGYLQSFYYFDNIRDKVFDVLIKNQKPEIMKKVNTLYNNLKYQLKKVL